MKTKIYLLVTVFFFASTLFSREAFAEEDPLSTDSPYYESRVNSIGTNNGAPVQSPEAEMYDNIYGPDGYLNNGDPSRTPALNAGFRTGTKCAAGFVDVGGICLPGNTGLSEAPTYLILSNIFSWLMGLFTTLAVLAFVVSGIQYFMASGDEDMAKTAKRNATAAVIGIIVGLSGFIIIKAVAAALSGQSYFF